MHSSNNDVYLYEDGKSQLRLVGKFFRGTGEKGREDHCLWAHGGREEGAGCGKKSLLQGFH